jgi:hypothetical protein
VNTQPLLTGMILSNEPGYYREGHWGIRIETLQVVTPPSITQQPAPAIACTGSSASFTVAATGAAPFTYRWRKDGASLFNSAIYSGVLTPVLTINSTDPSQSGDYQLVATKSCGNTPSQIATITFTCVADFNFDGGVDGGDIESFFMAWEAGDGTADVNQDGGVDGSDVDFFFFSWFLRIAVFLLVSSVWVSAFLISSTLLVFPSSANFELNSLISSSMASTSL